MSTQSLLRERSTAMHCFKNDGFTVVKANFLTQEVAAARDLFCTQFETRFGGDPSVNREIIKRFADHPFVVSIFCSKSFVEIVKKVTGITTPVRCGPLVSHYTSNDKTGNGYGLPYHQDYPSMGSSLNSVICWLNLVDSGTDSHGIEIVPGRHKEGLLHGEQDKSGYLLDQTSLENAQSHVPQIDAGDLLIMSSFAPHRTYVNPEFEGWKLSLSQRFDDLADVEWAGHGYKNAYGVQVDRTLYVNRL